jgi:hypothetical protein
MHGHFCLSDFVSVENKRIEKFSFPRTERLEAAGIPVFRDADRAVRLLSIASRHEAAI